MVFLWSQVDLELSTRSFRYYNDLIWYVYSITGFIPLILLTIYKAFVHKVDLKQLELNNIPIKRRWDDYAIIPFVYHAPIYYFMDALISVIEGTLFEQCRFALWYHHIICIVVLTRFVFKNIFFWWEAFIPALHALVVYGSGDLITYTYVAFIFFFNYRCYVYPYKKIPQFSFAGRYFPFIYYSFALLQFYGCQNPLPYLA